jgi:hypothetical protein
VPLVAANGVSFGKVHKDICELLELLLAECIRKGYPPKNGQCWGSVCRCSHRSDGTCAEDAAGNPIPSNHSYGLAIDFNSLDNVYGASTYKMPQWVPVLFRKYGFRWLGPPINDWQHFDWAGTPADAKQMTFKARLELGAVEKNGDDEMYEKFKQGWKDYQAALKEKHGVDPGPAPDGWGNEDRKFGWNAARFAVNASKV